ncbi:putative fatty acyl-CoA reductase CG5065 [Lycorma delicatula]|uniref:putative fatty acyl-CoA reductase CG5065 n=1 Tax=Lycorma delicatula TaxID=130591 RepID=UPI003F511D7A
MMPSDNRTNNNNYNNNNNINVDFNLNKNEENIFQSPIQNFYSGSSVLITGATGFVGKALVEKLLRSCPGIVNIFLLIRSKRGVDVETRFRELLKNPIFSNLQKEKPDVLKKVIAVAGDVTETDLGLNEKDLARLKNEANIVFHSAATVRFNERLQDALRLNTKATQNVIQFCLTIKKLQALVHVSTAYSNADKRTVEEAVYPPPADPQQIMQLCQTLPENTIKDLTETLLGTKHPNTYTLTKAMAEWVVAEQADTLPTAVVRPSIVTAAWKEPAPGWVDNISGITGIMMEIGRGTIRSIICDQKLIVDIIPVDIVVNTLVVAAWHTATYRYNDVRVYNCTSGTQNGIRWEQLGHMTQHHALELPSRHVQWYPGFSFRTNRFVHFLYEIFFHFLPAFIIDLVLKAQGAKPIMMKIFRRFKSAAKTGEFFALNEWKFCCNNQKSLASDMIECDRSEFQTDVSIVQWDEYVKNYMLGIRKFVLKDSLDSLPSAKRKLKRLFWLHKIAQFLGIFLLLKILQIR